MMVASTVRDVLWKRISRDAMWNQCNPGTQYYSRLSDLSDCTRKPSTIPIIRPWCLTGKISKINLNLCRATQQEDDIQISTPDLNATRFSLNRTLQPTTLNLSPTVTRLDKTTRHSYHSSQDSELHVYRKRNSSYCDNLDRHELKTARNVVLWAGHRANS